MNNDFETLKKLSRDIRLLEGSSALLAWDQETHMPKDAAPIRAEQLELLAGIAHKKRTDKSFSEALSKLIDLKTGKVVEGLSDDERSTLTLWRKDFIRDTALPTAFVEEFSKLSSQGIEAWRYAKENNAFSHFAPFLDKLVGMARKKADYLGFEEHPYDALLNLHEPDLTTREVSQLFGDLKKEICTLLKKITQAKQVDNSFLLGSFSHEKQVQFSKLLLDAMGFDKDKGRLDFSTHPFSIAFHPTDSRITTFIHLDDLKSNIFSVLHEAGHGLYEMGLLPKHYGTPLGESLSIGMHESQSKWWESFIGQSLPFWKAFLPKAKEVFGGSLEDVSLESFYQGVNQVKPSLILVEADEVTYPLHVILRFELERSLIEGSLNVRDLPDAWNEKMKELLGLAPSTQSEGCLQDIHWSMGEFGYFPSYTLGNLFAAQLFTEFAKAYPSWEDSVAKGELVFIKEWLNKNVHQWGRKYTCKELIKKITNNDFSSKYYIDYLNKKYSKIYSL